MAFEDLGKIQGNKLLDLLIQGDKFLDSLLKTSFLKSTRPDLSSFIL